MAKSPIGTMAFFPGQLVRTDHCLYQHTSVSHISSVSHQELSLCPGSVTRIASADSFRLRDCSMLTLLSSSSWTCACFRNIRAWSPLASLSFGISSASSSNFKMEALLVLVIRMFQRARFASSSLITSISTHASLYRQAEVRRSLDGLFFRMSRATI